MKQIFKPRKSFRKYGKEDFDKIDYTPKPCTAFERRITKSLPLSKLVPNPGDDFFKPNVGPKDGQIEMYNAYFRAGNTLGSAQLIQAEIYKDLDTSPICVVRLVGGLYMVVNGHHRVEGARMAGLKRLPVEVQKK